MDTLESITGAYLVSVVVLWVVLLCSGVWRCRQLGFITAFNHVVTGAILVGAFWPVIGVVMCYNWVRGRPHT